MFEIYSLGDGLFMKRVLDGVAMMSNEGFLLALGGFGMLIGLLLMGLKAIESGGQKVELPNLFVSFILILGMFSVKVDTTIYALDGAPGANTLQTYTVDNVPIGVAAPATIVSTIGKVITEKMQQAFSVPGMEEFDVNSGQFGNTLKLLDMTRRWDLGGLKGTQSKVSTFKTNLRSYYAECTIPAIQRGAVDQNAVMAATNPLSFHETDGGIGFRDKWTSVNYITSTGPAVLDCDTAMERLIVDSNDAGMVGSFLNSAMAMTDARSNSTDPTAAANSAFSAIGAGTSSIHSHVMASAIREIMDEAVAGSSTLTPQDIQAQLMLIQGNRQRQDEWGAGEVMFRKAMRPFMAFLECIVFIAAPFMALIAGMGTFGQRVVGKYFTIILWVTTWAPMFAAVDLFQLTMVQHAVTAMERLHAANHGVPLSSIAGAAALNSELTTWIAVGGWMATLVPPMGYLLLSGGAVAMTSFAGRLGGGDHINEKTTSPDLVKMGESMAVSNTLAHSKGTGTQVSGFENWGGSINFSSNSSRGVESSFAAQEQAQKAASTQLSNIASSVYTSMKGVSTSETSTMSQGDSFATGAGVTSGSSVETGTGISADRSKDSSTSAAAQATMGAKIGSGGGGGGGGAAGGEAGASGGGLASTLKNVAGRAAGAVGLNASATISGREETREGSKFGNQGSLSKKDMAAIQEFDNAQTVDQKLDAISRGASNGSTWAKSVSDQFNQTQTATDLRSSTAQYAEKSADSNTGGSLQGVSVQSVGHHISEAGGSKQAVARAIEEGGYQAFQLNKASVYAARDDGKLAGSDEKMDAIAAVMTLGGAGVGASALIPGNESDRREALGSLVNQFSVGAVGGGYGNARANESLQDKAPRYGEATAQTAGMTRENIPSRGEVISDVRSDINAGSGVDVDRVRQAGSNADGYGNADVRTMAMTGIYDGKESVVMEQGSENVRGVQDQGVNTPWVNHMTATGDFFMGNQTNGSMIHKMGGQYFQEGSSQSIPAATGDTFKDMQQRSMFLVSDEKAEVGESGQSRLQEIKESLIQSSGISRDMVDDNAATVIAAAQYAQETGVGTASDIMPSYLNARDAAQVESAMRGLDADQRERLFGVDSHGNDAMNLSGGSSTSNAQIGAALLKRDFSE